MHAINFFGLLLQIDQGSVSKLESRADLYLSTLREYIEALGGRLEMRADFPDGSINIELQPPL